MVFLRALCRWTILLPVAFVSDFPPVSMWLATQVPQNPCMALSPRLGSRHYDSHCLRRRQLQKARQRQRRVQPAIWKMAPTPDEQYQQQQPNTSRIDSVADCVTMYAVFCTENIPPPVWPHTMRLIASSLPSKFLYRSWTILSIKFTRAALQWLKMVTLAHLRALSRPPTWTRFSMAPTSRHGPSSPHSSERQMMRSACGSRAHPPQLRFADLYDPR